MAFRILANGVKRQRFPLSTRLGTARLFSTTGPRAKKILASLSVIAVGAQFFREGERVMSDQTDLRIDAEQLLERTQSGDRQAAAELLPRYRDRLRLMIELRLDSRLHRRLDASDVVQDALLDIASRLDDYLKDPKLPFFICSNNSRPARPPWRSSLLSSAWWLGPLPIPRCGPPATNMSTGSPRRSRPRVVARGFWIRAWGQCESALQWTGRSNDVAHWTGSLEGGLGLES